MSKGRALLILHGKQAGNPEVRDAVMRRRKAGWDIHVRVTWEGGDAARLVREALAAGFDTLIAGGGDGTLREVAQTIALEGGQASLVLLPLGTANDFARAAGVPLEPYRALGLLERPAQAIDLGEVEGQLFLNMATGGFGTRITTSTSEDLKKVLGGAAYLLTGLTRLSEMKAVTATFKGPDFSWQGAFLALGIGNGRQAGGGQPLCPEALVDDGLLDLCIVPEPSDMAGALTLLSGAAGEAQGGIVRVRLPWVEITAPEALDINLDGESIRHDLEGKALSRREWRFGVRPKALRVHLPADSVLLGRR